MQPDSRGTSIPFRNASRRLGLTDMVLRLSSALASRVHPPRSRPEPAARAEGPLSSPLRVLVVDDNPAYVGDACELLGHFGIVPMLAADGAEAVALACSHEFDVILMDLQMPVLDGLAATQQIRRFEDEQSGARAAILAFTSSVPEDEVMRHCGIDDVLEKPCTLPALQECLLRWLPPSSRSAITARPLGGVRSPG